MNAIMIYFSYVYISFTLLVSWTQAIKSCEEFYNSDHDIWVKGETSAVPFPVQLVAVFSYAPITFVLNTKLVVSNLFSSASGSFFTNETIARTSGKSGKAKLIPVPFSTYFDFDHYVWYWSQHKLDVIDENQYSRCFEQESSFLNHTIIPIKRIPDFSAHHAHEFAKLLELNKIHYPFPNHRLITFEGKFKMIGLYNFWNHLPMLSYVHQSLKPAQPIADFSSAVLKVLSNTFIAIHLRVDEEAFPTSAIPAPGGSEKDEDKNYEFLQIMNYLKHSRCFKELQHLNNELFIDPPTIYIMTNARPNSMVDKRKVKAVIEELYSLGFVNIFTRKRIVDRYTRLHATNNNGKFRSSAAMAALAGVAGSANFGGMHMQVNMPTIIQQLSIFRQLSYEQLQYVDLIVGKSATCFIPSQLPTVVSYLVKRLNRLDQNIQEEYAAVNRSSYGAMSSYRDWGI